MLDFEICKLINVKNQPRIHFGNIRNGKSPFIYLNSAFCKACESMGKVLFDLGIDTETGLIALKPVEIAGTYSATFSGIKNAKQVYAYIVENIGKPDTDYDLEWDSENEYFYFTIEKTVQPEETTDGNAG